MRTSKEALRACPTCGTKGVSLGLRDYTWFNDLLPGRCGATDFDCVIEHHGTGRMLILEFKPSQYIPRGQRLTFENEVQAGRDVYIIVDKDPHALLISQVVPGQALTWKPITLEELRQSVRLWWASNEAKGSGSKRPLERHSLMPSDQSSEPQ